MGIATETIKALRQQTGAGILECRQALRETGGDLEQAIDWLRKSGVLKADKKAARTAADGIAIVHLSEDGKQAVIIEVNCETDFVAREAAFQNFTKLAAQLALSNTTTDIAALMAMASPEGESLEETRQALVAKIGENIQVRRVHVQQTAHQFHTYRHGERIAVLVEAAGADEQIGRDVAMHIAAAHPMVVRPEDVPAEQVAKERTIYVEQAEGSGKPAHILEKIVEGQVQKFLKAQSLLEQPFVKNPEQTVGAYVAGAKAEILSFVRYEVGEGIEKVVVDFAEEVMAQVNAGDK